MNDSYREGQLKSLIILFLDADYDDVDFLADVVYEFGSDDPTFIYESHERLYPGAQISLNSLIHSTIDSFMLFFPYNELRDVDVAPEVVERLEDYFHINVDGVNSALYLITPTGEQVKVRTKEEVISFFEKHYPHRANQ